VKTVSIEFDSRHLHHENVEISTFFSIEIKNDVKLT